MNSNAKKMISMIVGILYSIDGIGLENEIPRACLSKRYVQQTTETN